MAEKIGVGKAHSKIILIGEHSVVYGYPAIAIPLKNVTVKCKVTLSDRLFSYNPEDTLSTAVYEALKYLGKENEKIKYEVESEIPEKRGMGSSAAVSIAGIKAVFNYFGKKPEKNILEELVNKAEIVAHTTPSGLDAKTCLSDKAVKFIRQAGFFNINLNLGAYLIIADSGIQGKTRETVTMIREMGEKAEPMLSELGKLTEETEKYIEEKDLINIGRNMLKANKELSKLGLSTMKTDLLIDEAMKAGALGAKISGGGQGGCIIALTDDEKKADIIKQALKEKGAVNIWTEKL
ncbi:mevalonate kinase [Leptotrichia sp. OH3620_COT-345]|nr:mevalonate kinase [Leptotrichia sp. OH3620_COT-345]